MREELLRSLPVVWKPLSEGDMVDWLRGPPIRCLDALAEILHLRAQRDELQARGTALLERARTAEALAAQRYVALTATADDEEPVSIDTPEPDHEGALTRVLSAVSAMGTAMGFEVPALDAQMAITLLARMREDADRLRVFLFAVSCPPPGASLAQAARAAVEQFNDTLRSTHDAVERARVRLGLPAPDASRILHSERTLAQIDAIAERAALMPVAGTTAASAIDDQVREAMGHIEAAGLTPGGGVLSTTREELRKALTRTFVTDAATRRDLDGRLHRQREEIARLSWRVDPLVAECADKEAKRAAWQHRAEGAEASVFQYQTAIAGAAKRAGIYDGPVPVDAGTAMGLLNAFVTEVQRWRKGEKDSEVRAEAAEVRLLTVVTAVAAAGKRAGVCDGVVPNGVEDVVAAVDKMAALVSPGRVSYTATLVLGAMNRILAATPIGAGRSPASVMAEVKPAIQAELSHAWQMAAAQEALTDRDHGRLEDVHRASGCPDGENLPSHVARLRNACAAAEVPPVSWEALHAAVEGAIGPGVPRLPRVALVDQAARALKGASSALLRCMETACDEAKVIARPQVGVAVLLRRPDGSLLMGRRKGARGAGTFCGVCGHMEGGETYAECASRELFEETGIMVAARRFKMLPIAPVLNAIPKEWGTFVTVWLVADVGWDASPKLMEPDKCSGWMWLGRSQPWPGELFRPLESLRREVALTLNRTEFGDWLERVAGPHGS